MQNLKHFALVAAAGALLASANSVAAQGTSALTVHGYLTQGFAVAGETPINGIPVRGTADYRSAALQFRYDLTGNDNFVLQFSHKRIGNSVLQQLEEEVSVDWGFYQHRFNTGSVVKVGKLPIPRGIYNETRDVGTVLPFYRAPINFYAEGFETINGAVVGQRVNVAGFGIQAFAFGGSLDYRLVVRRPGVAMPLSINADRVAGGQLWVETPISGVRVGGNIIDFHLALPAALGGAKVDGTQWQTSVDATRSRGYLRGEFARRGGASIGDSQMYYAQAGVFVTEKLSLNTEADFVRNRTTTGIWSEQARDVAVGVKYAFQPNVALKIEGHRARGYNNFDAFVAPTGPAAKGSALIGSMSVSF